jgi:hypothetical protein
MIQRVLRYNYSWGSETVPRASIRVYEIGIDEYIIYYSVEVFHTKHMKIIKPGTCVQKVLDVDTQILSPDDNGLIAVNVVIRVVAPCNPPPEQLFVFRTVMIK